MPPKTRDRPAAGELHPCGVAAPTPHPSAATAAASALPRLPTEAPDTQPSQAPTKRAAPQHANGTRPRAAPVAGGTAAGPPDAAKPANALIARGLKQSPAALPAPPTAVPAPSLALPSLLAAPPTMTPTPMAPPRTSPVRPREGLQPPPQRTPVARPAAPPAPPFRLRTAWFQFCGAVASHAPQLMLPSQQPAAAATPLVASPTAHPRSPAAPEPPIVQRSNAAAAHARPVLPASPAAHPRSCSLGDAEAGGSSQRTSASPAYPTSYAEVEELLLAWLVGCPSTAAAPGRLPGAPLLAQRLQQHLSQAGAHGKRMPCMPSLRAPGAARATAAAPQHGAEAGGEISQGRPVQLQPQSTGVLQGVGRAAGGRAARKQPRPARCRQPGLLQQGVLPEQQMRLQVMALQQQQQQEGAQPPSEELKQKHAQQQQQQQQQQQREEAKQQPPPQQPPPEQQPRPKISPADNLRAWRQARQELQRRRQQQRQQQQQQQPQPHDLQCHNQQEQLQVPDQ